MTKPQGQRLSQQSPPRPAICLAVHPTEEATPEEVAAALRRRVRSRGDLKALYRATCRAAETSSS